MLNFLSVLTIYEWHRDKKQTNVTKYQIATNMPSVTVCCIYSFVKAIRVAAGAKDTDVKCHLPSPDGCDSCREFLGNSLSRQDTSIYIGY